MLNKKFLSYRICLFFLSFLMVSCAQPDFSRGASLAASCFGYALLWLSIHELRKKKLWALIWFLGVQLIQLNWFFSDRYVGFYIYIFLGILTFFLGIQFALITFFIGDPKKLGALRILAISGLWVIFEWSRLFILSGFSWNPIGIAMSANFYGMQSASIFGVFGLSFWIIFTNLLALKCLVSFSWGKSILWCAMALCPYLFGFCQASYHLAKIERSSAHLKALLVQTSLEPEKKISINGSESLTPLMQWQRILSILFQYQSHRVDLVVLSEAVVPYGTHYPLYPVEEIKHAFEAFFGRSDFLPETDEAKVGNSYWAQSLANVFNADVVIGLEDVDGSMSSSYPATFNAAFLFHPHTEKNDRYEKRVLVPMGEYIPFNWCRKLLSKYGIEGAFTPGQGAKVFSGKEAQVAMSICYEETYGHLMRESRKNGADILINLTNDVWYPGSRLPIVHFFHGRLRAVENGMPILRSCNTGITCGLDSLGRMVSMLDYERKETKSPAAALYLSLPLYRYPTFYTLFGDWPIILLSFSFISAFAIQHMRKRKIPLLFLRNTFEVESD